MILWLLWGCTDPCWYTVGSYQGECRFTQVRTAWEQKDEPGIERALAQIPDPLERELALVRLAILSPAEAPQLCKRVTQVVAKQKCQQILGRPHLQDVKAP